MCILYWQTYPDLIWLTLWCCLPQIKMLFLRYVSRWVRKLSKYCCTVIDQGTTHNTAHPSNSVTSAVVSCEGISTFNWFSNDALLVEMRILSLPNIAIGTGASSYAMRVLMSNPLILLCNDIALAYNLCIVNFAVCYLYVFSVNCHCHHRSMDGLMECFWPATLKWFHLLWPNLECIINIYWLVWHNLTSHNVYQVFRVVSLTQRVN
jgi:hypothetical protein